MEEQQAAKGPLGWLEKHGPLVLGIFAAIAAGWYLLTAGKGGGAVPTAMQLPQSSGGGGASPTGGTSSQPSGYLPYNPDTTVAGNISDKVLAGLYTQLANAEAAANVAYSEGNTALFNQWQTTVGNLQAQIAKISGDTTSTPTPTPSTTTTNPLAEFTDALRQSWLNLGGDFYSRQGFGEQQLGLNATQAADFAQRVHLYLANGSAETADALNAWLAETRAGQALPTFPSATTPTYYHVQQTQPAKLNVSVKGR